jgi:uncharacterized protein (DUF1810 family)
MWFVFPQLAGLGRSSTAYGIGSLNGLLQRRREQLAAAARVEQPVLFALKEDCRPILERTAAGRYSEPSLFSLPERNA